MTKETLESVYIRIKERIVSPFYGTFVISWSVINYPIILALFWGKESFNERYIFIKNYVEQDTLFSIGSLGIKMHLVIIPTISVIVLLLGLSWISTAFMLATEWINKMGTLAKIKILQETPVSSEEFNKLILLNEELNKEKFDLIIQHESRLQDLKKENTTLQQDNRKLKDANILRSQNNQPLKIAVPRANTEESQAKQIIDSISAEKSIQLLAAIKQIVSEKHPVEMQTDLRDLLSAYDLYDVATGGRWILNKKGKMILRLLLEQK